MATAPPRKGLGELVSRDPTRIATWMAAILATQDTPTLGQIRNLGLSLAGAYAEHDVDMAARVFHHLKEHRPALNVVIGHEAIPLYEHLLFTASDAKPLEALRREVFSAAR